MNEFDRTNLVKFLSGMNVPEKRKVINLHNLLWLNRNLFIQNDGHPNLASAMKLIRKMLNQKDPVTQPDDDFYER